MQKETINPNLRGENHQMLAEALDGLYKSLTQKGGHLDSVYNSDILRNSAISSAALEYYYKDAYGIYDDVERIITQIFDDLSERTGTPEEKEQLLLLFEKLRKQPVVLRIILHLFDYTIWKNGRKFFLSIVKGWKNLSPDSQNYLLKNFYLQFMTILENWEKDDFSEQKISSCIRLAEAWLYADSMLADSDFLS